MLIHAWWHKRQQGSLEPTLAGGGIGFVANFLDTLGVGSFAKVKTACYKAVQADRRSAVARTLNGQCVLPTVTQSLIFIGAVKVDPSPWSA